ncbi:hypothetical protein Q5752_001304 [Cryptotrichosporon argae]
MSKSILVFGATGQQGSALIRALAAHNLPTPTYTILALSRAPSSASSTRLAELAGVRVVGVAKNYMDDPAAVFAAIGEVWGVFSVQGYVDEKVEEAQGKAIIDAASRAGVKHFVYSSVDFGGLADTGVAAFEVKRRIEAHLVSSGMAHTVLRPTQFMDNLVPAAPAMFKVSRTILLRRTFVAHPERRHQLVSARDVGRAGAAAFADPERYASRVLRLAGDQVTMPELEAVYREVYGRPVELTYTLVAGFVQRMVPVLGQMARFFDDHGFSVDIEETRRVLPDVEDLRSFLARHT